MNRKQILISILSFFTSSLVMAQDVSFEFSIAPILINRCIECHHPNDPNGNLDLSTRSSALHGGDSGPALSIKPSSEGSVPERKGITEKSTAENGGTHLMLERILAGEMPPEKNGQSQKLSDQEILTLRSWMENGAPWPESFVLDLNSRSSDRRAGKDWWSLQPIERPKVPNDHPWQDPIDALIGVKLEERHWQPAPPADPRTLLRRLSFDLTGLPPSVEQIDAFVAEPTDAAYERMVDQWLESPRFGERWARYWLDLVRYAETNGYERDATKPMAWRYRDWVIDAINSDMPYDQFVIDQLAGDERSDRNEASTIATGFLRLGTWDDEPNDPLEYQYDRLEDLVHATSTAFLGLTVKCARCHDHKFDPIPQTDYYRIAAAFWPGPVAHRQRELLGGPTKEELGYDVLGWTDITRDPPPLHLLKKGNVHRPGEPIAAGTLTSTPTSIAAFPAMDHETKTTKRRWQLAQWIVDPGNPLTARVAVNRLWLHLFGTGLVSTPDNFGFQGQLPTHPELLDWLARELIENGWRQKPLIKKIVMSKTYRQSSLHPEARRLDIEDASNRYYWRANRRRLDAESIRDSLLFTSGRLDLRMGGPSFLAPISDEALEGLSMKAGAYQASPIEETRRRSIYMFIKRSLAVPLMSVFDCCDTTAPAGKRDVTIVAPQALTLFNNEGIHDESRAIALLALERNSDDDERIHWTWRRILGRSPSPRERDAALQHVHKMQVESARSEELPEQSPDSPRRAVIEAWSSLCHVLINTNEFIFID